MGIEENVPNDVRVFQNRFGFLKGEELTHDQLAEMTAADLANLGVYVDGRRAHVKALGILD